jgi:hypothetical protein
MLVDLQGGNKCCVVVNTEQADGQTFSEYWKGTIQEQSASKPNPKADALQIWKASSSQGRPTTGRRPKMGSLEVHAECGGSVRRKILA